MKIAVANENGYVSGHFGHCAEFAVFECIEGEIVNEVIVQNPGSCHEVPKLLKELGVSVVITGGMGAGALARLNALEIDSISGATGAIRTCVYDYLEGNLKSTGALCDHHHEDGHHCGNHDNNCESHECQNHNK